MAKGPYKSKAANIIYNNALSANQKALKLVGEAEQLVLRAQSLNAQAKDQQRAAPKHAAALQRRAKLCQDDANKKSRQAESQMQVAKNGYANARKAEEKFIADNAKNKNPHLN